MTFYDSKYCQRLIDHCENGKSLESFCAALKVSPKVIEDWYIDHLDFQDAVNMAPCLELLYWEQTMIRAIQNKDKESITVAKSRLDNLSKYVVSPLKKNTYSGLKEAHLTKSTTSTGDLVKDLYLTQDRKRDGSH
jgi:hypothetical protein